jgi:hypothetical protein
MENISFFDIIESFFEQINPIQKYNYESCESLGEQINNIFDYDVDDVKHEDKTNDKQNNSLMEIIRLFFENMNGYNLYDDE